MIRPRLHPGIRVLAGSLVVGVLGTVGTAAAQPGAPAAAAAPPPSPGRDGKDPASRGLDVFVHAAPSVIAGDSLSIDLRTYGFPSVTVAEPLAGAQIVAAWDPESLGGVNAVPPDVTATTGPLGEARLEVPVPPGDARKLVLLLGIRHGTHARTRKIDVHRLSSVLVDLHIPDSHVVPGSEAPAWVDVTDARSGRAVPNASVEVALLEGDVDRKTIHVTTNASGLARATFFVPPGVSGSPALSLRARLPSSGAPLHGIADVESTLALGLREETPATPRLTVKWQELQLKPGETGHAVVTVTDAAGEPIASHPTVYWVGPKGTTPPASDEEWKKNGKPGATDGLGKLLAEAQAPRVVTSLGSNLTIVARTEIEGTKLAEKATLAVGQPVATATLSMEGGTIVPGVAQRAYLHLDDGEHGVAAAFTVEADGLHGAVTTDANGDAELTWPVPEDIGAARSVGPCAGGVAASVVVRQAKPVAALARHPEPFELCLPVDRTRTALLRTSVQLARIGDKPRASAVLAKGAARGLASVVVKAPEGFARTAWTSAGAADFELDLTDATPGVHEITLAVPRPAKEAETSTARILVLPRVLPKLAAKLSGGRIAPGGEAEVDVTLDDGHGAPILGEVTAVLVDKEGGGDVAGLERIDTRASLCAEAGAPRARCDAFLEGDPSAELERRAALATTRAQAVVPLLDPAAHATSALKQTFSDVLHSLEGAVYQSQTPESLHDVRRRTANRWAFNPELMTLVTAAMGEPPTTPGGEPFGLTDLLAIDPQVTFDNVARRVTRLKIFSVLAAVRSFKQGEQIDGDEPLLADPNALLRRLVREEKVSQEALLDPWGGSIQFVRSGGPTIPFLTVTRGFSLQSPGPDGRIGTGDDVKDPFERVVGAGSPYATAMGEDEIVDARWDMRVGDATVSGWQDMFDRLTGTTLGHGSGTGTGQGFGSGHGRLSGTHSTNAPTLRMGRAIAMDSTRWTEPVRTDAKGKARLRVPLGDYETTWRIALVGRTDAGQSAVSAIDVPAFLPLSAHVDVGRSLTVGDEVSARIVVRNRTTTARSVALQVSAEGGLTLAPRESRTINVAVPPNAVRSVFSRMTASSVGQGTVHVTLTAPGTDGDRTSHEIAIEPAGEPRVISTVLASGSASMGSSATTRGALRVDVPPGYALRGSARLVLESGVDDALLAALDSVEPESRLPPDALADAIEVASRVEKVAESEGKAWLVTRARKTAAFARAYLAEHESAPTNPTLHVAIARAALFARPKDGVPIKGGSKVQLNEGSDTDVVCPKDAELDRIPMALFLEAEPPPSPTGPLPCFTVLLGKLEAKTPLDLARATLALADRPHRAPMAVSTARELARVTHADSSTELTFDGTRAERAIVLAALARSAFEWSIDPKAAERFTGRLLSLRDARGGYGTTEATRDAVRALVSLDPQKPQRASVTVVDGDRRQTAIVQPNGGAVVPLGASTRQVALEFSGGPVLARLERPALRSFLAPPDTSITPVAVAVDWPNDAKAGTTGIVHVTYKVALLGHDVALWTRLPLPPGVELAAPVKDVVVRQGIVHIRTTVGTTSTVALPVRFTLPGRVLVREAETTTTSEEQPRALSPARTLTVRP